MAIPAQNEEVVLLPSASRTTTYTSPDLSNLAGKAVSVILDMTNVGTGSVTVTINGKDQASGKYYLLLAGVPVTTNSTNRYRVTPFLTGSANLIAQDETPPTFQIVVTANNANAAIYSVGYTHSRN